MHHHQQTLADLERQRQPDGWLILAGAAALAAAVCLLCIFAFSF